MYIDPLTLFIVGEVFVVYIIINVFLFYKSRLYNVLAALLKEMRFEKLRREQEKQAKLANQRASNNLKHTKEDSSPSLTTLNEQLSSHIDGLKQELPMSNDLINSIETGQAEQWLRIRLLELEEELLSGNINQLKWQELATEAISRLSLSQSDIQNGIENRKEGAEDSRYASQLETDLQESQAKLTEAMILIRKLESELSDMKSISTPTENQYEVPVQGRYEEELYQLKCDNYDLQESMNKLRLELQQIDPSIDSDSYAGLLESQITYMEQYIKSADISNGLLEKELAAAQNTIENLQKANNFANSEKSKDTLKALGSNQGQQADAIASIKSTIERLRSGEDPDTVLSEQEGQIAKLEQIIKESEQCIAILESELDQSSKNIDDLEEKLAKSKSEKLNSKLEELSSAHKGQKDGLGNLRSIVDELKNGGDSEGLLNRHSEEIQKLEGFLAESDTLIGQLEAEIEDLTAQLAQLAQNSTQPSGSKEDAQEMESLLKQYMSDTQSLLASNNKLAEENATIKNNKSNNSDELETTEPPVVTDVELLSDDIDIK